MAAGTAKLSVYNTYEGYRPTIYWYLSMRCNLQCRHCSVHSSPFVDISGDLDTSQALEVVRKIADAKAAGVILTGGEPLLRPDFITIFEALIAARVKVALETNGLLITETLTRAVRDGSERGVPTTIAVSLDGGTQATHEWMRGVGTFQRTLDALNLLKAAKLAFRVQCVLHDGNVESIPNLFHVMQDLSPAVDYLIFAFLHPVGRGLQMWNNAGISDIGITRACDLIIEGLQSYGAKVSIKLPPAVIPPKYLSRLFGNTGMCTCNTTCSFPTLGILPTGDVTVCALTRNDPSVLYGNIKTDSLASICCKANLDAIRKDYLAAKLSGICADCIFASTCKGGCRAYAYEEFNDFFAPHPLCDSQYKKGQFPDGYRRSHYGQDPGSMAVKLPQN